MAWSVAHSRIFRPVLLGSSTWEAAAVEMLAVVSISMRLRHVNLLKIQS